MKNYFHMYINHIQDDWADNLLIIKFITNNHVNASLEMILFFEDYRFHPYTNIKLFGTYNNKWKVKLLAVNLIIKKIRQDDEIFTRSNSVNIR